MGIKIIKVESNTNPSPAEKAFRASHPGLGQYPMMHFMEIDYNGKKMQLHYDGNTIQYISLDGDKYIEAIDKNNYARYEVDLSTIQAGVYNGATLPQYSLRRIFRGEKDTQSGGVEYIERLIDASIKADEQAKTPGVPKPTLDLNPLDKIKAAYYATNLDVWERGADAAEHFKLYPNGRHWPTQQEADKILTLYGGHWPALEEAKRLDEEYFKQNPDLRVEGKTWVKNAVLHCAQYEPGGQPQRKWPDMANIRNMDNENDTKACNYIAAELPKIMADGKYDLPHALRKLWEDIRDPKTPLNEDQKWIAWARLSLQLRAIEGKIDQRAAAADPRAGYTQLLAGLMEEEKRGLKKELVRLNAEETRVVKRELEKMNGGPQSQPVAGAGTPDKKPDISNPDETKARDYLGAQLTKFTDGKLDEQAVLVLISTELTNDKTLSEAQKNIVAAYLSVETRIKKLKAEGKDLQAALTQISLDLAQEQKKGKTPLNEEEMKITGKALEEVKTKQQQGPGEAPDKKPEDDKKEGAPNPNPTEPDFFTKNKTGLIGGGIGGAAGWLASSIMGIPKWLGIGGGLIAGFFLGNYFGDKDKKPTTEETKDKHGSLTQPTDRVMVQNTASGGTGTLGQLPSPLPPIVANTAPLSSRSA